MPSYATMSNASADGCVVFKITLERRSSAELRRVRGNFTFEEMTSVIRHMWNSDPKRLHVEYVDEDGDRVCIGSELEWSEALQHHVDRNLAVVRLFARRGQKGEDSDDMASESDAESRTLTPVVPPLNVNATHQAAKEPKSLTPEASAGDEDGMAQEATDASTEGTNDHENTIDLLSRLYDCDAAKEMQDMFSRVDFKPIVTRRVDAVAQEVHVDVDKVALRHFTVTRTNLWIGNALYEKAESTLEAAMRVWPNDHIFEYNTACSASLRGDLDKALQLLVLATEHGYRNVQQLKRDADLENVRSHPDFVQVINAARGDQVVVDDVPKPREAPEAPAQQVSDVDRFLAVFPHMTSEEADNVLKRFGNLTVAVNHCLATM
jgi:hypothetical protein